MSESKTELHYNPETIVEDKTESICSAFNYLQNVLYSHSAIVQNDTITLYVPISMYQKILYELTAIQRIPTSGNEDVVQLFSLFTIRPDHELKYLERSIENIRRIVL